MRILTYILVFVLGLMSSLLMGTERAYAADAGKEITDSLVQNLRCESLSVESIYRSIRPDAFKEQRNMPLLNWWYPAGLGIQLGNCWSMSSTQRIFNYLVRFNEPKADAGAVYKSALDMVRQSIPEMVSRGRDQERQQKEIKLKQLYVIPYAFDSFNEEYYRSQPDLWALMLYGYEQKLDFGASVVRGIREDLQVNQSYRFFRFGNIGMGVGSGVRSEKEDLETLETLKKNLSENKLTLINLRSGRTDQHVVMAKSYFVRSTGDVVFKVYDSNNPQLDQEVIYMRDFKRFYAPKVSGANPLGVFIVSEEERELIEKALLSHYKEKCR